MKLYNLHRQYLSLRADIDFAIASVIAGSQFVGGRNNPHVQAFEENFADYLGRKHCIGVGSGTDAIRITLEASNRIGRREIIPANTAFPTAEAVLSARGWPLFADCQEDYTLDLIHAAELVDPSVHTIIPVHLYGHPCDMGGVMDMAQRHNLFVLEDCAQAHGARWRGQKVGTFGHAAAFSFNPGKILGAMGDAGAIVTDDDELAERCRLLADHGRAIKYKHERIGYNSRMDGLQAAILNVKLPYLDMWVAHRRWAADQYRERLEGACILPPESPDAHHAYHLFVVRVPAEKRPAIIAKMAQANIQVGIHYPVAVVEQPALKAWADPKQTPKAVQYAREVLSLPCDENLTEREIEQVCDVLLAELQVLP